MIKRKTKKGALRPGAAGKLRIVAEAALPSQFGQFTILGIEGRNPEETLAVLRHGKMSPESVPLVRIHSQCLTGDVLASQRCDCRAQLEFSLRKIAAAPAGLLLYVPQEGRGIGLLNKLRAYQLQDAGRDTVEANEELGFAADSRDYRFTADALLLLGARRVRLLSNNPDKVAQLEKYGVHVVERVPCQPRSARASRTYLQTKRKKLGHLLTRI